MITDVHIHIQPWDCLEPEVEKVMRRGHEADYDRLRELMQNPSMLIEMMDRAGIWRVGIVNYPSPDLMGFGNDTNEFAAEYASHDRERILPYGGVHPRFTKDPQGDVDRLVDLGIVCLKIHPPHQLFACNAYVDGLDALGRIYRRAEEAGLVVMIHTGTSVFPGARSKYGHPMGLDDVAIDFPNLRILMAHGGRPLWMSEAFFILRRHKNVWLDISSIPPWRLLEYFPRLPEISDRVVWGTDWPGPGVSDIRANLDRFLALPLPDEIKRKITVENPLRLFPKEERS